MLVITVKKGDYVMINDDIMIRVEKTGDNFRLALDAPKEYKITRGKIYEENNPDAASRDLRHIREKKQKLISMFPSKTEEDILQMKAE